jgi:heme-degrading monooxygenase HmoA
MIARMWHGVTPIDRAQAYLAFLHQRALPDYSSVPGNRAAYVLWRTQGDQAHFVTLTFWDSIEAVHAFAGTDVDQAKYYPEDRDFLIEFEPTVRHFQVDSLEDGLPPSPGVAP